MKKERPSVLSEAQGRQRERPCDSKEAEMDRRESTSVLPGIQRYRYRRKIPYGSRDAFIDKGRTVQFQKGRDKGGDLLQFQGNRCIGWPKTTCREVDLLNILLHRFEYDSPGFIIIFVLVPPVNMTTFKGII